LRSGSWNPICPCRSLLPIAANRKSAIENRKCRTATASVATEWNFVHISGVLKMFSGNRRTDLQRSACSHAGDARSEKLAMTKSQRLLSLRSLSIVEDDLA
jgi:hypothetical protein